jgi:hypothetical protein
MPNIIVPLLLILLWKLHALESLKLFINQPSYIYIHLYTYLPILQLYTLRTLYMYFYTRTYVITN